MRNYSQKRVELQNLTKSASRWIFEYIYFSSLKQPNISFTKCSFLKQRHELMNSSVKVFWRPQYAKKHNMELWNSGRLWERPRLIHYTHPSLFLRMPSMTNFLHPPPPPHLLLTFQQPLRKRDLSAKQNHKFSKFSPNLHSISMSLSWGCGAHSQNLTCD